jgi:hypothetical protein
MYHPERRDLRMFHHEDGRYIQMEADDRGRIGVPELGLEIGMKEGWLRFWHEGNLLNIPSELDAKLRDREHRLESLLGFLRELAKTKAVKAGRADILANVATADQAQLQAWLAELESAQGG